MFFTRKMNAKIKLYAMLKNSNITVTFEDIKKIESMTVPKLYKVIAKLKTV